MTNPPSAGSDRRRRDRRRGTLRWPFWVALVLLAGACGWFLYNLGDGAGTATEDLVADELISADEAPAGDRAVILVFPEWDASGFVSERRRIPSRGRAEEDLLALMNELCEGPARSGAISALPGRTRVLAAFLDQESGDAVLDFSAELVIGHPGGSAAEAATLISILRTVALNFPQLRTCRILVDGSETETLGGHLSLDHSFDLRRWL